MQSILRIISVVVFIISSCFILYTTYILFVDSITIKDYISCNIIVVFWIFLIMLVRRTIE